MKRDFITLSDYSRAELEDLLSLAQVMKQSSSGERPLAGKTVALIFEKPSLRTHVSFEVGITQLGGQSVFLSQQNIGLATRESAKDVAEVLSRYNDLIVARTMKHETVEALAAYASVPVINALTDLSHPCQIMADALTLAERGLLHERTKVVFIGDGNNVANSWIELAGIIPFRFVLACPNGYEPDQSFVRRARRAGGSIEIIHDPIEASTNADVLYTDVWTSMGQEAESEIRRNAFRDFQINKKLLRVAHPHCVVMHCLPAHRGEEISAEVLDGKQSIVMDEAENRLHIQKAIMTSLIEGPLSSRSASYREQLELSAV